MKRSSVLVVVAAACAGALGLSAGTADARQFDKILKRAQQARELVITEDDEVRIGEAVSEKVRVRYGVVQDPAVHRYVSLVGMVLASESKRPNLPWKFIVLDTDGVNAFAAPGGFIHITRGALGLVTNEAELAGVLAHEIQHVVLKHTTKAIQKTKAAQITAEETLQNKQVFARVVDATTDLVMAGFGRNEELESDREGVRLANAVGYNPSALTAFLTRLSDRNKGATEKQGLFASHPEMKERLDKMAAQVTSEKLASTATLAERYHANISYKTKAQAEIVAVVPGASGLASGSQKDQKDQKADAPKEEEKPKKRGFGLASMLKPGGSEKKSAEVTGSGASRGVDTERNAKGGAVSTLVSVNVKPADIAAFKKEGKLK